MTAEIPTQENTDDNSVGDALAHLPGTEGWVPSLARPDASGNWVAQEIPNTQPLTAEEIAAEQVRAGLAEANMGAYAARQAALPFAERVGAGSFEQRTTGITAAEVDVTQPLSPLLASQIEHAAPIDVNQLEPVDPTITSKHDVHPDQQRFEAVKAALDASADQDIRSMTDA